MWLTILKKAGFENISTRDISSHLSQHSQQWICLISEGALINATTEALPISIFRQSTRDHEIIDMPLYREFRDVVAQLEKPGFEDYQGSFAFTSQRCYDTQREKQKGARDDTSGYKFLSMFCVTVIIGRSVLMLRLTHKSSCINRLSSCNS